MNKPIFRTFINDAVLSDHVHSVFHLPPNDRDLSLIGLVWASGNMYITRKNICFCSDNAMKLAEEKFHKIRKVELSLKCRSALDGD
jgi:REP element-mobilizing transposase RayT